MAALYSRDNSLPPVIEHNWQCLETVWKVLQSEFFQEKPGVLLNTAEAQVKIKTPGLLEAKKPCPGVWTHRSSRNLCSQVRRQKLKEIKHPAPKSLSS